jgi:hypothetical protein
VCYQLACMCGPGGPHACTGAGRACKLWRDAVVAFISKASSRRISHLASLALHTTEERDRAWGAATLGRRVLWIISAGLRSLLMVLLVALVLLPSGQGVKQALVATGLGTGKWEGAPHTNAPGRALQTAPGAWAPPKWVASRWGLVWPLASSRQGKASVLWLAVAGSSLFPLSLDSWLSKKYKLKCS